MGRIEEDIKSGQLNQIYFLCGEEAYLRKQYKDKLQQALTDGDTMNYHYYEGKDVAVNAVIDVAETMPFMAERRVIIMENTGLFKHGGEDLADYLGSLPETTFFVFVEDSADKRSKLYKAVTKNGCVIECATLSDDKLSRWVLTMLARENKKITGNTMEYLLSKTGTDMENIRSEVEKLICYCMDKDVITVEDIDAICTKQVSNQIFDMINAMADKKQKQALQLYYDLLALKEPPMRILFLIGRQFNILLQVKTLKQKGYDNRAIGEKIGLPGFIAGKYVTQSTKFKVQDLRNALEECVLADEAVKTGNRNDRLSVELLIIQYSC